MNWKILLPRDFEELWMSILIIVLVIVCVAYFSVNKMAWIWSVI